MPINTSTKCRNCGGEYGLHHYQTNQCPVGGREAPIGRKQEYKATTFEPDTDGDESEIPALRKALKELTARVEELEEKIEGMEAEAALQESVRIWGTGEDK